MAARLAGLAALSLASLAFLAAPTCGETIYFKNKRAIEATAYQVKGALIYITMTNGKVVHLRADSVDWEGTERLKKGDVVLRATDYSAVDDSTGQPVDEGALGMGRTLTSSDLRKAGAGFKLRRAGAGTPTMVVEVRADLPWTDSGINAKTGQELTIQASGRATVAPGIEVGPEGIPGSGGTDLLVVGLPHGALLTRIGLGGTAIAVGRGTRIVAPAPGRLYFAVNDRSSQDNSGSFSVRVELPATGTTVAPAGSFSAVSPGAAARPGAPAAAPAGRTPAKGMVGGVDRARNVRDQVRSRESE